MRESILGPIRSSQRILLKTRSDLHLARKLWHLLGVLFIVTCYIKSSRSDAIQLAVTMTFLFVSLDILRHSIPNLNKIICKFLGPIMREEERHKAAGTSSLMIGTTIIVFLFSEHVVILSLLFLAIADPFASFIGVLYGKDKIVGQKSLQGTVGAFFACLFISAAYFYFSNLMTERILIVSILSAILGAISELIPIWKLDDNLTFPVLSATFLYILFLIFGGL